jgi:hypothetical protein
MKMQGKGKNLGRRKFSIRTINKAVQNRFLKYFLGMAYSTVRIRGMLHLRILVLLVPDMEAVSWSLSSGRIRSTALRNSWDPLLLHH